MACVQSYWANVYDAAALIGIHGSTAGPPAVHSNSLRSHAKTWAAVALSRVVSSGNEVAAGAVRKIGAGDLAAVVESLLVAQGSAASSTALATDLLKARSAGSVAGDELVTTTLLARLRGPQLSEIDVGSIMDVARRAAAAEATVGASFIQALLQFGADCRRARDSETCYATLSVLDGVLGAAKRGSWRGLSRESVTVVVSKAFGLLVDLPLPMAGLPLRAALSVLRRVIELVPKGSMPIHTALIDHSAFDAFVVSAGSCADVYSVAFVLDSLVAICESARACGDARACTRLQNLALASVAAAVARPLFGIGFLRAAFVDGTTRIPRECVSAAIEIIRRPTNGLTVGDNASVWYAALSLLVESADIRDVSRQLCADVDESGRVILSQLLLSIVFSPSPTTAQVAPVIVRLVTELLGLGSHLAVLAEAEMTLATGCVLEVLAAALPDAIAELHGKAAALAADGTDGMGQFDAPRIDLVAAISKVSARVFVRMCVLHGDDEFAPCLAAATSKYAKPSLRD